MRQSSEQRRLLAVVVADIVGYSRLMAENEADTFYRLKDLQTSLITPALERNHGRVVKWTGDGFLATFDSAVDAVRAAVEVQSGAAAAGASADDDRRIRFRIGINAGDVIVVPGDVYGDTVNVAARLETLAAPGGICISRGVRDTVRGKFSVEFEDRGELAVKNIPDPVGTFSVIFDPIAWTMGRDEAPPRAPFRRPSPRGAAAVVALVAVIAIGSTWYFLGRSGGEPKALDPRQQPVSPAGATASALHEQLAARFAATVPSLTPKVREEAASKYEQARAHKAQAVSIEPAGLWRIAERPTAESAEESALENCQVFFGRSCVLVAVDGVTQPIPPDGNWRHRPMPRVTYAGEFDPVQIPGSSPVMRERGDIVKYRSAPAPKAAAFTPHDGRVFTVTGAVSQRAAAEEALRRCEYDPARARENGACFLYASADRVVLKLRLTAPLTAMPTTAAAPASSLRELLSERLASAAPNLSGSSREDHARAYAEARGHKAQAASPEAPGVWRAIERPSAENAEVSALENCQIAYGRACVLIVVNDAILPAPTDNKWQPQDMPRVRYAGLFEPDQIPGAFPDVRRGGDIVNYRSAQTPKAAAFSPSGGRVFTATAATSQRAAEEAALKACDADPLRKATNGPCFLYATGDQVVLPRRLKEPLTAAPPR